MSNDRLYIVCMKCNRYKMVAKYMTGYPFLDETETARVSPFMLKHQECWWDELFGNLLPGPLFAFMTDDMPDFYVRDED